jgi:hypothetical protein
VLLDTRRERKKGKRVILKGQIIVSRDSIIQEVKKIDREAEEKKEKKGKTKKKVIVVSSDKEEEDSDDELLNQNFEISVILGVILIHRIEVQKLVYFTYRSTTPTTILP